ncbi:aminotransferase-like domain-containing protein [Aliamphritea hakodatensis]|uniref:aminotransferase-like domain-containing protein n=1 Tax=Aliamphritea hakodatensis TaxID=2895352 RepID=UPI0022FD3882|nr:PLP-dependent aminotransferase family protein [Aliamphritea hakodatensis]
MTGNNQTQNQTQTGQPRYLQIAGLIEQKIRNSELSHGTRLPAIRQLAADYHVSINTIRSVLDILEQQDLISRQPRQGTRVNFQSKPQQHYRPFEPFKADSRLAPQAQKWLDASILNGQSNGQFINMVLSPELDMFRSFQRHYHKVLLQPSRRGMESSAGYLPLRDALCRLYAQRQTNVNPTQVQITSGCQHAMEHALRTVCQPGDNVAVPTPAFPGYLALLGQLQLNAVEVPMTPAGPDYESLKTVMYSGDIAALIINPVCHNPTGVTISDDYKRDIAHWANSLRIPVIEDDICATLNFSEAFPRPVISYDTDGWCMLVSSISKIVGDSERLGWCLPGRFRDAYMTQVAISQISGPYFRQKALANYLNGSRYASQLRQWRGEMKAFLNEASEYLHAELGSAIEITSPSGGYALWIRLPDYVDVSEVRRQARAKDCDFLPGEVFSLAPRFKQYIRLVLIPPKDERYEKALQKLTGILKPLLKKA